MTQPTDEDLYANYFDLDDDEDDWEYLEADDVDLDETPEGQPTQGWRYPYTPHPKQALASQYLTDEMLFGGSAGPGKGHPVSVANMRYNDPMGQPQDRDVQVLTPFGFKPFADVKVGDQLTNPDGTVQRVIQVFELGERDIYRVTFSDGATTLVTDDHLWLVNYSGKRYKAERTHPVDAGWSTKTSGVVETTANLRAHLATCHAAAAAGKRPAWPLIPLTQPVPFTTAVRRPETTYPIKPYALGVLLGDGALGTGVPRFHSIDPEIAEFIREDGDEVRYYEEPRAAKKQGTYVIMGAKARQAIQKLDIAHRSYEKRIPRAYLIASIDSRWNLARGLMDTDGTASSGGDATYITTSPGLAEDTAWLLRSLGFRVNTTTKTPAYVYNGERRAGRLAYTLHIQGDRVPDLFRLPRKADRCKYGMNGGQRVKRRMVSIEHVGVGDARCIKVNHPNSLYITDDFIVTHNTDWMLAELVNLCLAVPTGKTLLLRNTYQELQDEIIPRLEARIPPWVGKYSSKLRAYIFYNGARLRLGYLERDDDKRHYIGAEYMAIGWDELTLLPWSAYTFLRSRVRATGIVDEKLRELGLRPRMLATSNPTGPYHMQVKGHFVDPAPPGRIVQDANSGLTRVYVPATIEDNPSMPPEYRRMLMGLDPAKRKALLEGSWDVLEGVRFSQWNRADHVIKPSDLPIPEISGERVIAVDYGWAAPFAALWGIKLGNGFIVVYREAYATELTAVQQAELIREMTPEVEWRQQPTVVMDPSMWGRRDASSMKTGTKAPPVSSPAHDYQRVLGVTPVQANNSRKLGAARLDEKLRVLEDGFPRLLVYENNVDLIRTIPTLLRGKIDPDDISQKPKQEDHLYDALRYLLMHLDPADPTPRDPARLELLRRPVTAGIRERQW